MRKFFFVLILSLIYSFSFAQSFSGFALYNAQGENTTYLIDENLNIAHTWTMSTWKIYISLGFATGILRFMLRLILEMFCQSLSIKSNEGVSILPIFLNNANDEDGFPPL